ncbi:MAG: hypothetical protein ACRYGA_13390 [Janthinobacterium lividum]
MNLVYFSFAITAAALGGCVAPTGIVPIGNGTYMSSKMGGMLDYSGGGVKAELYKEAGAFCVKQGKEVQPMNSTSTDSGLGTYASAEVQFRCL